MYIDYRYIPGYDDKYIITNYGEVITLKELKPRALAIQLKPDGYIGVCLYHNGNGGGKIVHVLVGNAFVGKRTNGLSFDHIDRCRSNNRADNLRLATRSEQSINTKVRVDNNTGERNITYKESGKYKYHRIRIRRDDKIIIEKGFNIKKYTLDDCVKIRDETIRLYEESKKKLE